MNKILISLIVLLNAVTAYAQSFEGLAVMHPKEFNTITIHYDKAITEIINKPVENDRGIKALVTRLVKDSPTRYLVTFDPGPSGDPEFIIYEMQDGKEKNIISLPGEELVIPGNGILYTSCFADRMFNTQKKFLLHDEIITEVQQPFYYVGLQTKLRKSLALFGDPSYKEIIAQLPAGSKVEVLINKENDYLIKTPFGLVGWLRINYGEQCGSEPVEGICFHGD
jgi:hypothetical protein